MKKNFPKSPTGYEQVLKQVEAMRDQDVRWQGGKVFSLVYHYNDEHYAFLKKAHNLYFSENGLNPGAFPSLAKFETEVVSMALDLLHAPEGATGSMTCGGTESILLAVKTYREWARANKPAVQVPEMILPTTIHPAFEKASHYFGVKAVHVPMDSQFRVDVKAVEKAITPNTILIVGSAPAYPWGVMDPIADLARLAKARGISMHVDACVGGFMLPFVKKAGQMIPDFDFTLEGVTSMSADVHKYGYSAKGASIVLYRFKELRLHQYFAYADWPGGLFGSPGILGTRPGGPIAAAWAAVNALGEEGYLKIARDVLSTTAKLKKGVAAISGLKIIGEPVGGIFAYQSDTVNLFAVADLMETRGWFMDRQQHPTSIHLTVSPGHAPIVEVYLKDLRECVTQAQASPNLGTQGKAAMYGAAAALPDRGFIGQQIIGVLDQSFTV